MTSDGVGTALRWGLIRLHEDGLRRRSVFGWWREPVRLVAPGLTAAEEEWLPGEVSAAARSAVRLEVQLVDQIPLTAAGKLQVVVNRLGTPGRGENA